MTTIDSSLKLARATEMIHLRNIPFACAECHLRLRNMWSGDLDPSKTFTCDSCDGLIGQTPSTLMMECKGRMHPEGYHLCHTCCSNNALWCMENQTEYVCFGNWALYTLGIYIGLLELAVLAMVVKGRQGEGVYKSQAKVMGKGQ